MATATDDFTDTDGVQLTAHGTNWSKLGTYDPDIQSNGLCPDASGQDAFCYYNALTPGADQYSQIKIVAASDVSASIGPMVRMATGAITGYLIFYAYYGGWELWKFVDGSATRLANGSRAPAVDEVLYLEATGTSTTQLIFKISGVTITTVNDSSSPITSGRVGLHAYDDSTAVRYDDWEGGDFAGPPASLVMESIMKRNQHLLVR